MPDIKKVSISSIRAISKEIPIMIKRDNQSSIFLINNPVLHIQTKYIDMYHYYICNDVVSKKINFVYILMEEMLADRLIKHLLYIKFLNFIRQI